jgi:hypothetical protein
MRSESASNLNGTGLRSTHLQFYLSSEIIQLPAPDMEKSSNNSTAFAPSGVARVSVQ